MANYSSAFSPSFRANTFVEEGFSNSQLVATQKIPLDKINFNALKKLEFNPVAFTPGLDLTGGWTFITAPEDVSWDIANNANRVDIFGTNNPPVVAGSRGMRDLTLSNALVEGFMRGVSLEGKISALENLMNYSLNASDGFVSVPVYQVWASEKSYGGPQAYYIIKDVKIKETMRDLKGNATRAYVDISLMQVPAYQVNSGRDLASKTTAGVRAGLLQTITDQANQQMQGKGGAKPGTATSKPASGPEAGGGATTAKKPPGNQGRRGDRAGDAAEPFQPLGQPLF